VQRGDEPGVARGADSQHYDVAIVGAGPAGSVCALAHAQKGARVALFEASLDRPSRLAGEWLHPPALRMLQQVGIHFDTPAEASMTDGFMVFPEDGSEPILLPYPDGSRGIACEHGVLVARLRDAVVDEPNIDLIPGRVHTVDDGGVAFTRSGVEESMTAGLIVGADGQRSVVRRSLGLTQKPTTCSRMLGFELDGVPLPMEGYGSVVCGAPGPIFIYRLRENTVRINVDIPLRFAPRETTDLLLGSYAPLLPEAIKPEFTKMVHERGYHSTANTLSPRVSYGAPRRLLIGDAAGHYHPMTAVGLTLSLGDALAGAESEDFRDFVTRRFKEIRAPEMLALAFYEMMVDQRDEAVAVRHSVYRMWRENDRKAQQSMRLLGCEDTSEYSLGFVGATTVMQAAFRTIPRSINPREWRRASRTISSLVMRIWWFIRGVSQLRRARADGEATKREFLDAMERALPTSMRSDDRSSGPRD
jgi:2-polyprenyl-6-methoxyphenol hydroxylase-like FAD-dependent oxidoreductase